MRGKITMKKTKCWKKRVLLIALAGTMTMTFSGCKAKEEIAIEQDAEENKEYYVPNLILIDYNTMEKKCAKVMEFVSKENNTMYLKSITNKDIGAVIQNFGSEEEKCIVTKLDTEGNPIWDKDFYLGIVNHSSYIPSAKQGEINEDNKISYKVILELEEELATEQEKTRIDQENKYAEDLLKYRLVVDANKDIILTEEIREINYSIEGKYYQILGYLEKEQANEKTYRSITTPENSIIVKLDEEGKIISYTLQTNGNSNGNKKIELQNILGDFPAVVGRFISYEQALKFEAENFIDYNYNNFKKNHEEVAALVYKVEDDYQMRFMEYVGELDGKVLFQKKYYKDDLLWLLGAKNNKNEIVDYQVIGGIDANKEFVSIDTLPQDIKFSDEEIEKLEKEYENKKEINDNFDLIENLDGEWNVYKNLASVTYNVQGFDKNYVMMVGLIKTEGNRNLYRCLTIPEFYLEETYNKETYTTTYKFIPKEGIKENFTRTTEITSVAFSFAGKTIYTYEEIQEMEEAKERLANENLESDLGR